VELLAAGVRYAAACLDASEPESDIVAALVRGHAGEAYVRVATEAIQVLGGIGFTWEHPAHLYFRRATSSATLLGGPEIHRELLASRLGLDQRRSRSRLSG
jgi:alkylation response protein AidB-like acyl-CoA dehydrogenase